ncbi:cytochrome C [Cupriavidus sp. USMAHM13]|uniref:Cytochrome C n=1 Tax=Cupriavidus malaysiensis TaxID=367825 RepID=A0ABM7D8I1_9BURK|nr:MULTISPECIES: c-type cytochrome [Cupriavidus]AOZ02805.1 cytochrome C [Cupriavidus sp. USMAHM13]AOZ09823.1 cytochrome C [Cupriavidus malaysiensis]
MRIPLKMAVPLALALALAAALPARAAQDQVPFVVPDPASVPKGAVGEAILRGKALLSDTRKLLPGNVGNGLNCTNCHLNGGTVPYASPWVGLTAAFPEYRARSGKVISLQERVNDCFQRSMNGKPLAPDSGEMNDILAYMKWLSTGVPVGHDVAGRGFEKIDTALVPDSKHGAALYAAQCASCHGAEGQGMPNPAGGYVFPPVWGKDAFNVGAGMARLYTAAAFVKHNMPLGQGGTLSAQDAVDVAAYFTQQPRPDYAARAKDWPLGGKPKDAR